MSTRFQVHPDCADIVIDTQTGLQWQRGFSEDEIDYVAAQKYVTDIRLGGFSDWRLPTHKELKSLVTKEKSVRDYYQDEVFSDRDGDLLWCWSSTRHGGSSAWVVRFNSGYDGHFELSFSMYVRAVRNP